MAALAVVASVRGMNQPVLWTLALLGVAGCGDDGVSVWESAGGSRGSTGQVDSSGSVPETGSVADTGDPTSEGSDDAADGDTASLLLDVGATDVHIPTDCACGNDEWSYLWLANSNDSTVSKINTETMVEEARYVTHPDRAGNPSRTSVSVNARSVAVANRHGGLVKIWARDSFCDEDRNGQPGLQTSTGPNDVLPWGQDDCVDWYVPFEQWTTQRPVAWSGRLDAANCQDEAVWTAGCGGGSMPGFANAFADTEVALVDGIDGTVIESVTIPGYQCTGFGPYGGAVAPDGKLWLVVNNGDLASVDRDTLATEIHPRASELSPYGITVDKDGMVWVSSYSASAGAGRLDPTTGQWATVAGISGQGGIAQSLDGRIWAGAGSSIAWIDPDTVTLGGTLALQGGTVKGVSGDVQGNVWGITGTVSKIDVATDTVIDTLTTGQVPYTYSDMTGAALSLVAGTPAG